MNNEECAIGVQEAAKIIGCTPETIRRWRKAGAKFPAPISTRTYGWSKWRRSDIERFARGEVSEADPAPSEPFLDGGDIQTVAQWGLIG